MEKEQIVVFPGQVTDSDQASLSKTCNYYVFVLSVYLLVCGTYCVYSRTSNLIGLLWVAALLFLGEVPFLTLFVYCFPNQSCEFL